MQIEELEKGLTGTFSFTVGTRHNGEFQSDTARANEMIDQIKEQYASGAITQENLDEVESPDELLLAAMMTVHTLKSRLDEIERVDMVVDGDPISLKGEDVVYIRIHATGSFKEAWDKHTG